MKKTLYLGTFALLLSTTNAWSNYKNPLTEAIVSDQVDGLEKLMIPENINLVDEGRSISTPLQAALVDLKFNLTNKLVEKGADISLVNTEALGLSGKNHLKLLKLHENGKNYLEKYKKYVTDKGSLSHLSMAAYRNELEDVQLMLDLGFDMNAYNEHRNDKSPLYYAAIKKNKEMVKLLLDNGANPEDLNVNHVTRKFKGISNDMTEFIRNYTSDESKSE